MYVHFPPQGAVRCKFHKVPSTNTLENRSALTQHVDEQLLVNVY